MSGGGTRCAAHVALCLARLADAHRVRPQDGTLSVIDRKKNLVELAGGEYIALERLESLYGSCEYAARIMVHADSNANRPMAVRALLRVSLGRC